MGPDFMWAYPTIANLHVPLREERAVVGFHDFLRRGFIAPTRLHVVVSVVVIFMDPYPVAADRTWWVDEKFYPSDFGFWFCGRCAVDSDGKRRRE
jgi:hypothetical protein